MKDTLRILIRSIGIIIFLLTMVIFFVGFGSNHKETIDYLSLIFILISELVVFIAANLLLIFYDYENKVFMFSGTICTLFIYLITTILLSIFSKVLFYKNNNGFVTVQVIIIAIAAILSISFFVIGLSIMKNSKKINGNSVILQQCENEVFSLKNNAEYKEIADLLNNLYEEIRFSDKSVFIFEKEEDINSKIDELSENIKNTKYGDFSKEGIVSEINKIILLVKERNYCVKQLKSR